MLGKISAVFASTVALGCLSYAAAQDYPTRPVKIVVQYAPGGVPDTSARFIAERLSLILGQPFVVENKVGAGGNIGTDFVVKSQPDGYTLLLAASASLTISPNLYKRLPFKVSDLTPVSLIGSFDFVMLAAPALNVASVAELVKLAKSKPERLSIASSGFGSEHHLVGELFKLVTGAQISHVPYKGFGPAATDVMAGHVDLMFGSIPAASPYVRGNKMRGLAVTGPARSEVVPNIPTFSELGYPQIQMTSWVGLFAPSDTPQPILDKLSAALERVLQSEDTTQTFEKLGLNRVKPGSAIVRTQIEADTKVWSDIIKQSGINQLE